jgi:penicillin-binding protein 2
MVIPREKHRHFRVLQVIKNHKRRLHKTIAKAKVYSPRLPSVFLAQLNKSEFAAFQEKKKI